jgi:hypothetical protein
LSESGFTRLEDLQDKIKDIHETVGFNPENPVNPENPDSDKKNPVNLLICVIRFKILCL